jgi:peptide/nickel transport system substrate-binding protein
MNSRLPWLDRIIGVIETAKPSDRFFLRLLFFVVIFCGLVYTINLNQKYLELFPSEGGELIEGIIGIPRFINPALAITKADQDTVALLYSGLMRIDEKGYLVPDLAENVTISEDGRIYNIKLKTNRKFHDGTPITTRDVAYTIELVKDPTLKSPQRGNWNDVSLESVGEYELNIILKEPYSPFIENFTLGIMPHHIWSKLPIEQLPFSQHNTEPIGSGPFKVAKVHRDTAGLISGYSLAPTKDGDNQPNLAGIALKFYSNEENLLAALTNNEITSTIYLPTKDLINLKSEDRRIQSEPLPRVFGIFFNQNRSSALRDKGARLALSQAIDREKIVSEILHGYGVPMKTPTITTGSLLESSGSSTSAQASSTSEEATNTLLKSGWKKNETGFWEKKINNSVEILSLTIKTSNTEIFSQTVNRVVDDWRKLGVDVQVEQYEQTGLVQSVIRTRDFDALLFGLDMNRTQDLYPFWHSSQKDDPGINVSQYTNVTADRLLEQIRNSQDREEQIKLLEEVSLLISDEVPAVFLFAPYINYVIDKSIMTATMPTLGRPSDRFMNVTLWYAKTESLWPIFHNN